MSAILFALIFFVYNLFKRFFKPRPRLSINSALITGATSGIGESLAFYLLNHYPEMKLVLTGSSENSTDQLAKRFKNFKNVVCCVLDQSDEDSVTAFVDFIKGKKIIFDAVIYNAGKSFRGDCLSTETATLRKMFDINFFGVVSLNQKIMQEKLVNVHENSVICWVGSVQAHLSVPFRCAYCSSKAAALSYFDCLRAEIGRSNQPIRVLTVHPSYVATNLSLNSMTSDGSTYGKMDDNTKKGMSPEQAAEIIHDSLADEHANEIVITDSFKFKVGIYLRKIFPNFIFNKLKKYN